MQLHPKKSNNALTIVLLVVAVLGTMLVATCVAIGGMTLLMPGNAPPPPPLVRYAVPTASEYYGSWKSNDGVVTLTVSKDTVTWLREKKSGASSSKVSLEGNFVGISPSGSIQMKMLVVSKTLEVSNPPHIDEVSGEWRMTVEGADVTRFSGP